MAKLASAAVAASLVGCASDTRGAAVRSTDSTQDRSRSTQVEAKLLERYNGSSYGTQMALEVTEYMVARIGADLSDRDTALLSEDEEHLRHAVSCAPKTGNVWACAHSVRGRVFRAESQVEAVFDAQAGTVVIRSERERDGAPFPG